VRPPAGGYRRTKSGLIVVRRMELGLREYGPTPFPAYADASVVSVRSVWAGLGLPVLSATPEDDPAPDAEPDSGDVQDPVDTGTPSDEGSAADAPPPSDDEGQHASRHDQFVSRIRAFKATRPGLARPPSVAEGRAEEIRRAAEGGSQE
jgi:hypothetical protein